jgi:methylglyoxal synthase
MRNLERQRVELVARSHEQRQQLIEYGSAARDALARMRLVALLARGTVFMRRLRKHF